MTIFEKTLDLLRNQFSDRVRNLTIAEVRMGQHLTAVLLSDGSCGVSSNASKPPRPLDKSQRDFGPFTPGNIKGRTVAELFDTLAEENCNRSLVTATMNALSANLLFSGKYKVLSNTDPFDLMALGADKRVVIVGAFQSYIKRVAASGANLQVLEMKEAALQPIHRRYYVPAEEYPNVLPMADAVVITGLTLTNDTLDDLLAATPPSAEIMVTGPTSSFLPDALFEKNVKYIGGIRITNPTMALVVAGEGGGGYHLFHYCAEKICVVQ